MVSGLSRSNPSLVNLSSKEELLLAFGTAGGGLGGGSCFRGMQAIAMLFPMFVLLLVTTKVVLIFGPLCGNPQVVLLFDTRCLAPNTLHCSVHIPQYPE